MLFNSSEFAFLVVITFILYYVRKLQFLQVGLLLVSSLIFYAWAKPLLVVLLLLSILINGICTFGVSKYQEHTKQKFIAWGGIIVNLGLLAFFKYNKLLILTLHGDIQNLSEIEKIIYYLPLPVGISFFTFQGISLLIDVYREKTMDQNWISKHPLKFLLDTGFFISFFPQLVAGPIVKAKDFYPQIRTKHFKDINWMLVIQPLIVGYFLKMVVADNLKEHTQFMSFPAFWGMSGSHLALMLFGYSMQIFADFAGYSLIAIGLAALFGYTLMDNFMFPYISTSFQEFWTRWHISLSSWLKEYLYISLGGNRKGNVRTYFNLMVTMVLGGLWHGAAWSYAVWGAFHGLLLVVERFLSHKIVLKPSPIFKVTKGIVVFTCVSLAWLLFRLPEFNHAVDYLRLMTAPSSFVFNPNAFYIVMYSLPVIVYHLLYLGRNQAFMQIIQSLKPYLLGMMLFMILTNSGVPGSFIYFRF